MDAFNYKNGELYCEDVPAEQIAEEVGTACCMSGAECTLSRWTF